MKKTTKTKKVKNSKRLSAYGQDPEDLIRKALNTPPPEDKKTRKK